MSDSAEIADALSDGRAALARSDWEKARELYQRAVDDAPSGEALDGLGQATLWLGDEEKAIEIRAKAFEAYRVEGDAEAAANVAIYLAAEYRIAGNSSLANGWLGRGTRVLAGCGDCPARVWLHIERSKRAVAPEEAEAEAERALEVAGRLADPALEGAAMSHAGRAKVSRGEISEGMALLEEAMAIATSADFADRSQSATLAARR